VALTPGEPRVPTLRGSERALRKGIPDLKKRGSWPKREGESADLVRRRSGSRGSVQRALRPRVSSEGNYSLVRGGSAREFTWGGVRSYGGGNLLNERKEFPGRTYHDRLSVRRNAVFLGRELLLSGEKRSRGDHTPNGFLPRKGGRVLGWENFLLLKKLKKISFAGGEIGRGSKCRLKGGRAEKGGFPFDEKFRKSIQGHPETPAR